MKLVSLASPMVRLESTVMQAATWRHRRLRPPMQSKPSRTVTRGMCLVQARMKLKLGPLAMDYRRVMLTRKSDVRR